MSRSVFSNLLSPKFAKSEPLVSPLPSPALERALRRQQGSTRSGEPEAGAGWCCPTKPPPSPSYILWSNQPHCCIIKAHRLSCYLSPPAQKAIKDVACPIWQFYTHNERISLIKYVHDIENIANALQTQTLTVLASKFALVWFALVW